MYQIEKNNPVPEQPRSGNCKYPFSEMQNGDSFFVPKSEKTESARVAAYYYGKRHGIEFKPVYVDGGLRIWRVGPMIESDPKKYNVDRDAGHDQDQNLAPHRRRGGARKYPFGDMADGTSFLVSDPSQYAGARSAAYSHGRRYGVEFRTRLTDEGLRVWRVGPKDHPVVPADDDFDW